MKNEALMFVHPVENLKAYDLDPQKWDVLNPPELFQVENSAVTPYMPALMVVEVVEKVRVDNLENGKCRFFFRLNREINDLWQLFFENHRNGIDVTFEGNMLILCCETQDLPARYDEICHSAIHQATREYRQERETLLWQVFLKMKEQEWRNHWEAEIQTELATNPRKPREILENKFKWWSHVLDAPTIGKYRALFEFDFLPV